MFSLRVRVNYRLLALMEAVPARTVQLFRDKLATVFYPELVRTVDGLMVPGPLPVASPFIFATPRSARFYFAMIRANPLLTDPVSKHWLRTFTIERGFRVFLYQRPTGVQIVVRNIEPKSTYVYHRRVPGHIMTGWPDELDVARDLLHEMAVNWIVRLFREARSEAVLEANGR